jgi:hypothetical protein
MSGSQNSQIENLFDKEPSRRGEVVFINATTQQFDRSFDFPKVPGILRLEGCKIESLNRADKCQYFVKGSLLRRFFDRHEIAYPKRSFSIHSNLYVICTEIIKDILQNFYGIRQFPLGERFLLNNTFDTILMDLGVALGCQQFTFEELPELLKVQIKEYRVIRRLIKYTNFEEIGIGGYDNISTGWSSRD